MTMASNLIFPVPGAGVRGARPAADASANAAEFGKLVQRLAAAPGAQPAAPGQVAKGLAQIEIPATGAKTPQVQLRALIEQLAGLQAATTQTVQNAESAGAPEGRDPIATVLVGLAEQIGQVLQEFDAATGANAVATLRDNLGAIETSAEGVLSVLLQKGGGDASKADPIAALFTIVRTLLGIPQDAAKMGAVPTPSVPPQPSQGWAKGTPAPVAASGEQPAPARNTTPAAAAPQAASAPAAAQPAVQPALQRVTPGGTQTAQGQAADQGGETEAAPGQAKTPLTEVARAPVGRSFEDAARPAVRAGQGGLTTENTLTGRAGASASAADPAPAKATGSALISTDVKAFLLSVVQAGGEDALVHRPLSELRAAPEVAHIRPPEAHAHQPSGFSRGITDQIRKATFSEGRTRIELAPRGLGEIEIDVQPGEAGRLRVVVRAENPAVLHALRTDRDSLLNLLDDSGVSVEDGDLELGDFSDRTSNSDDDIWEGSGGPGDADEDDAANTAAGAPTRRDTISNGVLDITT